MRKLLLAAVAAVAFSSVAYAGPITYTSYGFSGGNVHINFNDNVAGDKTVNNLYAGAGLITLNTASGSVNAFCVDIFDHLAGSGTYQAQTPGAGIPTYNPAFFTDAANLIARNGNAGGTTAEATQIAIWLTEYNPSHGGVIYNKAVGSTNTTNNVNVVADDGSVAALVAADLAFLGYGFNDGTISTTASGHGVGYNSSLTVTELYANLPGNGNQNLITKNVPEPATVGILGSGLLALGLVQRRRRTERA